jgi:hypothetical protein
MMVSCVRAFVARCGLDQDDASDRGSRVTGGRVMGGDGPSTGVAGAGAAHRHPLR